MKQLDIESQLRDVISRLVVQVELASKQGRTDINLALEDAFIPILKSVYNLPNLINLNRQQKNYPGIDLGDSHDRIAFQITSTTSLDKVKKTLNQFIEKSFFHSFDELFVLTLVKKQSSYSQSALDQIVKDKLVFKADKHIIDLGDILTLVTGLRIPAQERILNDFKLILGEVNAFVHLSESPISESLNLTSNLVGIDIPQYVYVADLLIDEKEIIAKAKQNLNFKRQSCSKKSLIKMALLLIGEDTDSWVCYENKIFSFLDIENHKIKEIVDQGTIETLNASDLSDSNEIDNVNIFKQLLFAQTQEKLKNVAVKLHKQDKFFYFMSLSPEDDERKIEWVGKKKATRSVYERIFSKKDPSKVAHHKHLSFSLSFTKILDNWYCNIVPSWFYSFNGISRSKWHDSLLSQQKRMEYNQTVRNLVRFVAHFIGKIESSNNNDIQFNSLLEFSIGNDTSIELEAAEESIDEAIEEAFL